jgi:hypothetical protein
LLAGLVVDEDDGKDSEDAEEEDHTPRVPGVGRPAPLEGQEEGDDCRHEDDGSPGIEAAEELPDGGWSSPCAGTHSRDLAALGVGEEPGNDNDGDGANGEVDEEAPPPSNVVGECTADQGTRNGCQAVHASYRARVDGALGKRDGVGEDCQSAGKDACCANAGDSAADDEGHAVLGDTADERAELEEEDGGQVDPFDGEEGVETAEEELEGSGGEEVGLDLLTKGLALWTGRQDGLHEAYQPTSGRE